MEVENQPEASWTVFSDLVGLRTERKAQLIDLTELVAERVRRSGVRFGLASIQSRNTAVAVFVDEGAPSPDADSMRGRGTQTFQVSEGVLQLGRGQRVFLAELDGPRPRQISILILGLPGLS